MRTLIFALTLFSTAVMQAEDRPAFLPFDLSIGGHKAVIAEGNELFSQIDTPVAADAVLATEEPSALLIVNAFACEKDGTVKNDAQPAAVIFAQNTKETKLDATMDKKPLPPGTYLANVVAHGQTSRVVFVVGGKGKKVDFTKVLKFLKEKAGGK